MIELRTRTFLTGATLAFALSAGSVPAAADAVQILSIQTGHSLIVSAPGLTRVAVGDGRIAGVVPVGTSQVVINGKTPGHTTIFVWTGAMRATYEVTVTEQSFDDIAKVLRAALDEPNVQVVAFNSNLIVRGTVGDTAAFQKVSDVLERFKGVKFTSNGGNGVIVNAVTVQKPLGTIQDDISSLAGTHGLRVDPDAKGNVVVSGEVRDQSDAQAVLDKVKGLAGPYLATDGKVISRLNVQQTSQVDVKVYVMEVDKTAQSNLGLRLGSATLSNIDNSGTSTFKFDAAPSITGLESTRVGSGPNPFLFGPFARVSLLAPTLNLLVNQGHSKLLSSPNLVTQPGQEATFLVGGEIPIPISNGLGSISIQYKEFGVKLNVTPTILGNGAVETKITPEVSDLDFADGITINGFTIPALKTSRISTDVITQDGESIVMGGLLRRQEIKNVQKFPVLGDLPILGSLFRSTNYQKNESDVIFVMTPTIITR